MSNMLDLEPGADDLTTAMAVDETLSSAAASRRRGRGFETSGDSRDNVKTGKFDSLRAGNASASAPMKSIEGWIILVTGIHEEASEDDVKEKFADFGEIKNIHLNLDRRTGFVKGYSLIEYNSQREAKAAIDETDGTELLGQQIHTSYAFVTGPPRNSAGGRESERRR
ncbi:RNA-binding protein 8A [Physocladia obscura]|uniref:RNA-binding protein 8A n=1 Tax=Physocladia obscura TaxID=109957 RepID=A0AAD5XDD6_9FUNG|nr:RNA-binding protein 8A [Physocladia obscura]